MKSSFSRIVTVLCIFLALLLFPACNAKNWQNETGEWFSAQYKKITAEAPYQEMEIFYGTDRKATGTTDPENYFKKDQDKLNLGTVTVAVPYEKNLGQLEGSAYTLTSFGTDEADCYELLDVRALPMRAFETILPKTLTESSDGTVLVFVPGYNVSFENAALMTARMSYNLQYRGAPIFYSWPAQAEPLDYMGDEQAADITVPHLQEFLMEVVLNSGAESIHLIGSDMGCLPLSRAFAALGKKLSHEDMFKFKDLILIAPDINRNRFATEILPKLQQTSTTITVFTSSRDKKLMDAHKERYGVRLGDVLNNSDLKGVAYTDASAVDTSLSDSPYFVKKGTIYDLMKPVIDDHHLK